MTRPAGLGAHRPPEPHADSGEADRLPDGFQVQVDRRCVVDGDHLICGSPIGLTTLTTRTRSLLDADGRLVVRDDAGARLGRELLDTGMGQPRPMFGPTADDVTVIIPVRDNQSGLDRALAALRGLRVIVVDDGSAEPAVAPDAMVLRHDHSVGASAARNRGAGAVETDFVAFVDSDVAPDRDWLTVLLPHFSDPTVAMVAPRIVGSRTGRSAFDRFDSVCSSLDKGRREGAVAPGARLPYVPSAAVVVRRSMFPGFDESFHVAGDVDLCWRLAAAGRTIRYDPLARAIREQSEGVGHALRHRRHRGTGVVLLTDRHSTMAAPLDIPAPLAVAAVAILTRSRWGVAVVIAMLAVTGRAIHRRVADVPGAPGVAARLTAEQYGLGFSALAAALCRHYWPISVLLAVVSPRFRTALLAVALTDGVVEWVRAEKLNPDAVDGVGVTRFVVLKRLDDLAYGAGVWEGVVAHRAPGALRPVIAAGRPGSVRPLQSV